MIRVPRMRFTGHLKKMNGRKSKIFRALIVSRHLAVHPLQLGINYLSAPLAINLGFTTIQMKVGMQAKRKSSENGFFIELFPLVKAMFFL